jgi:glycosyltransferase involved in cell wall biosynthesis
MFYPSIARRLGRTVPFVYYGALHTPNGHVPAPVLRGVHTADVYVAFTSFERDLLVRNGIPEGKIRVIGLGVDQARFATADGQVVRARFGIQDQPVVAFVGRLASYKGVDTLLTSMRDVWKTVPDAHLLIAGARTDFVTRLEAQIAELPERERRQVVLACDVPDSELPSWYAACDVFVTVSENESFGLVYLEAWAAGKPVIGGRIGSVSSVIAEGEDGLLVGCGEVDELTAALRTLLSDEALRNRLGESGRKKVERDHDWSTVTDRLRGVYQSIL